MEKITAIVLAGGRGSRMGSSTPKQYLMIDDKPIMYYSLAAFEKCEWITDIVLVVNEGQESYCQNEIVQKYHLKKVKKIVSGGAERYDSVYQGLLAATGSAYVLIHDSARPCIDQTLLDKSITCVRQAKACIAAVPVKDTIKVADSDGTVAGTPDRSTLWTVQTPQSFAYELILSAYQAMYEQKLTGITDDAMVVERTLGHAITLCEGSYKNIKVTTPEDLTIAAAFLA